MAAANDTAVTLFASWDAYKSVLKGALQVPLDYDTSLARLSDIETSGKYYIYPFVIHFVFQWMGFLIFMSWDYSNYKARRLNLAKLPTRHPLEPFWREQLRMLPLVLFNQLCVWPTVTYVYQWRLWEATATAARPFWEWAGLLSMVPALIGLTLVSDFIWYWAHRWMHTRWAWRALHKMHHVAPQAALSATYVHPVEYSLWCISISTPFVLTGYPMEAWLIPLAWGMLTGSGAHSGYSGWFANGDEHNGHHLYHQVNFSLVGVADVIFGTKWNPEEKRPKVWRRALDIAKAHKDVVGQFQAETEAEVPDKDHLLAGDGTSSDSDIDSGDDGVSRGYKEVNVNGKTVRRSSRSRKPKMR